MKPRIALLASGAGSNVQAILDHFRAIGAARSGRVVLVASNRADAPALSRAEAAGVASHCFDASAPDSLLSLLDQHRIDAIALAGYLRLVPESIITRYRGRILNVHPGPLPEFGGRGMHGLRVHEAVLASGAAETAVTVHFVDELYDQGAVLLRWPVPILVGDTPEQLAARTLRIEHIVYPRIIDSLAATITDGLDTADMISNT